MNDLFLRSCGEDQVDPLYIFCFTVFDNSSWISAVLVSKNKKRPVPVRLFKYHVELGPLNHHLYVKVFGFFFEKIDFLVLVIKDTAHFII